MSWAKEPGAGSQKGNATEPESGLILGAVSALALNYQHLRAFHAIASAASVSRAARLLSLAQPTLSQQLKALEDRHRVVLFEDRKPPLRLTAQGRELFALTQRLFAASN